MKKLAFKSKCVFCTAMALLATFSLFSEEDNKQKHVIVGSRVISMDQHVAALQERAKLEEEMIQDEELKIQSEIADADNLAEEKVAEERKTYALNLGTMAHHAYYYSTHSGAFHQAIAVSPFGETVELIDGSVWHIHSWDSHKTLDWLGSDVLVISPNHSWFSSYLFRITNQNTGVSVEANLSLGPIYNGYFTHWIIGIDHYNNVVVLEDGSIWNMSIFDSNATDNWMVNDTVIIGINDGWLSSTRPNILINVNMLDYACGISSY